jgi:hypothetical protein
VLSLGWYSSGQVRLLHDLHTDSFQRHSGAASLYLDYAKTCVIYALSRAKQYPSHRGLRVFLVHGKTSLELERQ